jgi:hypothetical protein
MCSITESLVQDFSEDVFQQRNGTATPLFLFEYREKLYETDISNIVPVML